MNTPRHPTRWLAASLLLCSLTAIGVARNDAPAHAEAGFAALFDGRTLEGWQVMGAPGWTVKDGVIVAPGKGGGWLRSDKEYDDFVLRVEFKNSRRGNSGISIRAGLKGRTSRTGMEIQILDDAGKTPSRNSSGSLYDMVAPTKVAVKPAGEWNEYEITADGTHIRVKLNGETVQDVRTDDPSLNAAIEKRLTGSNEAPGSFPLPKERRAKGYIGLQNHGTPAEFRNIRIKEL